MAAGGFGLRGIKEVLAFSGSQADLLGRELLDDNLCALGDFSTMAVSSALERFPEDFAVKVVSGQ